MGSGSSSRDRPPIDRNLDDLEPGFSHEGAVNSKRSATFLVRAVMLLAPIPGCVVVPGVECRDRLPVRRLIVGQEPLEPGLRGSIAITSRQQLSSEPSSALAFQRIDLEQGEHRMSSNLRVTHSGKGRRPRVRPRRLRCAHCTDKSPYLYSNYTTLLLFFIGSMLANLF